MRTLTLKELNDYKVIVCKAFLDAEVRVSKANNIGYKGSMEVNDELLIYYYLLNELPEVLFFDDNYESLVSTHDLAKIINRVYQIQSELSTKF